MLEKLLPPLELETPEEQVVYYGLSYTWIWYALGATYLAGPLIGWTLIGVWVWRWVSCEEQFPNRPLPMMAYMWWLGMGVMWVSLLMGHMLWNLGVPMIIKSSIGWMKGWALFAVFIMIGSTLHIRPAVIYRGAMVVVLQTAVLIPMFIVAPLIGLPGTLFISPLLLLGGPGPEFFEVQLYGVEFEGGIRWRFFAPWAPAAAVAYGFLAPLILRERPMLARGLGMAVIFAVVMMSKSRLGMIAIPVAVMAGLGLSSLTRPKMLFGCAIVFVCLALSAGSIMEYADEQNQRLAAMRAESSYVRNALGRIALYRWQTEAPVFGHGIVERGPHLVEFMPIGSHHSWYGLLFVKGAVGFAALLVPLIYSWIELLGKAQCERTARTALTLLGMFTFTTFTENVEMLAYLMWPAFVVIGIAGRRRFVSPLRPLLGAGTPPADTEPMKLPALSDGATA